QLDVSRGLALAVLALIAVLPEYVVDFTFAAKAGGNPEKYAPLALANMTGSNRLLIGVGWAAVVLIAAWPLTRIPPQEGYEGPIDTEVRLDRSHSIEIAFLAVATLYSLTLPLKHNLTLFDAAVLILLFVLYGIRISKSPAEEPHLVGPARLVGQMSNGRRRVGGVLLPAYSAVVILLRAAPVAWAVGGGGGRGGRREHVPARAVARAARVRSTRAHRRLPVRVAPEHERWSGHTRVVEGEPVDSARRIVADRVRDLRRRDEWVA